MATVRINTSDTDWIKRHAIEDEVVSYGTDIQGRMYFQIEYRVAKVQRVTFAHAAMIRFDFGPDVPCDHQSGAMYPATYLVAS